MVLYSKYIKINIICGNKRIKINKVIYLCYCGIDFISTYLSKYYNEIKS